MPRKPNYGFERKERERAKAAKTAERVKAKTGTSNSPETAGEPTEADRPQVDDVQGKSQ